MSAFAKSSRDAFAKSVRSGAGAAFPDKSSPFGRRRFAAMFDAFFKIPPSGKFALIVGLLGNGIVIAAQT